MLALRKLSPGGYEYLTGRVACGDRELEAGESLSDYYLAHGYPPGEWFGAGAAELGVSGEVTAAQMNALFGEGRHPNADQIEADLIRDGTTVAQALRATRLGRRFAQYGGVDELRSHVVAAYRQHNVDHGQPIGAPIDADTRAAIRLRIQKQAFTDAHHGTPPADAEELNRWLAEQKRALKTAVAGYEAILAPPKSYSVAWAVADARTRQLLASLHRQAAKDTVTQFERTAAFTRRGNYGEAQVDIVGITAALFEHWDSRAGDPHLHTHVPISAKVKRIEDGKWTTLDGRTMFAATVTMSEFYNSRLRDLSREHGAVWAERPADGHDLTRPVWELAAVPATLIAGFSRRAQQVDTARARLIVAFRHQHGREPAPKELLEIGRRAQYGTRRGKQAPRSLAEHLRRWRAFAAELVDVRTLDALGQALFGGSGEPISEVDIAEIAERTRAVVSDHYAHFNRWNIDAEAHRQTAHLRVAPGTRDAVITRVTNRVITAPDTVALQAPALVAEPPRLRRASGESVFIEHNSARYTTTRTLREETALVAWARRFDGHRLTADTLAVALGGERLNPGQQRMVTAFARSGRRIQLALAPAGAGKTTALRVFAQAWRSAGGRVYAFGPSARAAAELGDAIHARPHTLHQVTTALHAGVAEQAYGFRRGDVLVIDEAAMAGTHTLHIVVRYALDRGADVRLVGDDQQLGAVEAGGAIRFIAHEAGAIRFREVVRFHDRRQAAASLLIREGSPDGLAYYLDHKRVHGGSRETMRDAAHRAWRSDLDAGRQSLLIVPTTEDVVQLNLEARALRIQRGDVLDRRSAALHDGTRASGGDWVVTRRNNRILALFAGRDFVKNGDTWVVTGVRRTGALEVTHLDHQARTVLPADYVATEVELAYATTVNRAEGMTVEHTAHLLVPQTTTREQLYPGATRARGENHLYVETHHHVADEHHETPPEQTPEAVLTGVLAHSGLETPATEELRASLHSEESLATLVARHNYAARYHTDTRIDTALAEHVPQVADAPAEPALVQTLRTAEDLGWQADRLIPDAIADNPLADADDPAAVLQWRIDQRLTHHPPPPHAGEPTVADITRWRAVLARRHPTADLDASAWEPVWRHADAATAEGLDVDTALGRAADRWAHRPAADPVDDHRYLADALLAELDRQRAAGAGWRPALPWLARPDHTGLRAEPDLLDYLQRMDIAIANRLTELRTQVVADPPPWTAGLGTRPTDPQLAAQWDELAGLAAAFRDTYQVTTIDPTMPLGPEPDGNGLKARAWRDLIDRWAPPGHTSDTARTAQDERWYDVDLDQLMATVSADEAALRRDGGDEPLSVLAARYRRGVWALRDAGFAERAHRVMVERAPSVRGQPAEPALMWLLRRAEEAGWRLDQIIPDTDSLSGLGRTTDPAAVLYRRVQHRLERATPSPDQPSEPVGPLPWLTAADPDVRRTHPELTGLLDQLGERIAARAAALRDHVTADPPGWAAGFGVRPDRPDLIAGWDRRVGLAAAYRETYHITTDNPAIPLGPRPGGSGPQARAWNEIMQGWRKPLPAADDLFTLNQQRIEHLRDHLLSQPGTPIEVADSATDDREVSTLAADTVRGDDQRYDVDQDPLSGGAQLRSGLDHG